MKYSKKCWSSWLVGTMHRRIFTEEKAKVVAAVWGTELLRFSAALAILQMKSSNSSNLPGANNPVPHHILQMTWCKFSPTPQTAATTFAFFSVFFLLWVSRNIITEQQRGVWKRRHLVFFFFSVAASFAQRRKKTQRHETLGNL